MWLVKLAISRPIFIIMLELFLVVLGIISYQRLGVDLYPKIDPPIVTITTEFPGAGPEEVENLVTKLVEEQVNEIGSIERLISTSKENISQVIVEFRLELDAQKMMIEVQDKIARIRPLLPKEIKEPLIQRLDFANRPIMRVALLSEKENNTQSAKLFLLAQDFIKPRLQQVSGVGQIDILGGLEREIKIDLDFQKMKLWNISPEAVSLAIEKSNINIPSGDLMNNHQLDSIRVLGEYIHINEIEETLIKKLPQGKAVLIKDIASVYDSFKDITSIARVHGVSAVVIELKRQSDTNSVEVSQLLQEKISYVNTILPSDTKLEIIFDGAQLIRTSLRDVVETMIFAALLAVLVVYLFLGNLQSTLITGLALPATLIATCFGFYILDYTLNNMTLLGLTLSVGLILDDAIVVRENIWRKLEEGMSPKEASFEGTRQVYIALIATTFTVLATFFPVTWIPGIVGRFFSAFALTVCLAILFSTLDALIMAPMMSAYLTKKSEHPKQNKIGEYFLELYLKILRWSLDHPKRVLFFSLFLFVGSLGFIKLLGFSFLPATEYGEIDIDIEAPVGTTIQKTDQLVKEIETILREYPIIQFVSSRVGNRLGEPHLGSLFIKLVPKEKRNVTTAQMKSILRERLQSLKKKENLNLSVQDAGGGGGGQKQITVIVQGQDFNKLVKISHQVLDLAKTEAKEIVNLTSNLRQGRQEEQFILDRKKVSAYGINSQQVGYLVRGFFEGMTPRPFRSHGDEFDIRVRLSEEYRKGNYALDFISVPSKEGTSIALKNLATFEKGISPTKIVRIDRQRAAMLEGDLDAGVPLGKAIQSLSTVIEKVLPNEGFQFQFQGQAKSMRDLSRGMVIALGLGSLFIYMIMASLYESLLLPFAILLTVPLAIIGALSALLIANKFLDLYAVIGIILLMALVSKNAILLIDYVEQIRRTNLLSPKDALMEAGKRRLRPILMTTVAMIAGMIPLAFGMGELNTARSGMGVAAMGGLISSTLLSLVVIPCSYLYLDRWRK